MMNDSNLNLTAERRTAEDARRPLDPVASVLRVLFGLPALLLVIVRELLAGGDGEVTYTPPTVEQDLELAPVVAVPVAIPVSEDELPVADLAPVLALPYDPEPKPASKKRAARKSKVMTAAARTAEPLFVKRGKRYVESGPLTKPDEKVYRRIVQGKRTRYQAA
jgi:hypothetical protein